MVKNMKLSENQQTLLGLVPEDFKGTLNEKLVYGEFIHCNNCAINRNEKTFTLGFATLEKETELGRTTLSKIVNDFIRRDIIGRCEIGTSTKNKNSTYYTFVCSNKHVQSEHTDEHTVNSNLNIQSPCESDSYENGEHTGEHTGMFKVNTNYNINYNNKENIYNIDHINLLQLEIDQLKEEIQILKNHIANIEERKAERTEDNINIGVYNLFDELDNISMDDECYNTPANLNVVSQSDQQTSIERTAKRTENNIKIDNFSNFVDVLKDDSSTFEDRESAAIGLQQMINDKKLRGKMFGLAAYLIKQHKKTYNSSILNDIALPQVAQTPSQNIFPDNWDNAEAKKDYNTWYSAADLSVMKLEDVECCVNMALYTIDNINRLFVPKQYVDKFIDYMQDFNGTGSARMVIRGVLNDKRTPKGFVDEIKDLLRELDQKIDELYNVTLKKAAV